MKKIIIFKIVTWLFKTSIVNSKRKARFKPILASNDDLGSDVIIIIFY